MRRNLIAFSTDIDPTYWFACDAEMIGEESRLIIDDLETIINEWTQCTMLADTIR